MVTDVLEVWLTVTTDGGADPLLLRELSELLDDTKIFNGGT